MKQAAVLMDKGTKALQQSLHSNQLHTQVEMGDFKSRVGNRTPVPYCKLGLEQKPMDIAISAHLPNRML